MHRGEAPTVPQALPMVCFMNQTFGLVGLSAVTMLV